MESSGSDVVNTFNNTGNISRHSENISVHSGYLSVTRALRRSQNNWLNKKNRHSLNTAGGSYRTLLATMLVCSKIDFYMLTSQSCLINPRVLSGLVGLFATNVRITRTNINIFLTRQMCKIGRFVNLNTRGFSTGRTNTAFQKTSHSGSGGVHASYSLDYWVNHLNLPILTSKLFFHFTLISLALDAYINKFPVLYDKRQSGKLPSTMMLLPWFIALLLVRYLCWPLDSHSRNKMGQRQKCRVGHNVDERKTC